MLELASLGARVLHNRSVEMAKKYHVKMVVRSSLSDAEGTIVSDIIKEAAAVEKQYVSGIALDKDVARVSVVGITDKPGMAYKIFSLLAREKVSVDIILQSIGRNNTKDITFTVSKSDLLPTIRILQANQASIGYDMLSNDENIAKLSAVGAGMATNFGVASTMFEALYDCGVNINMISTSEIKISVLIDAAQAEKAANAVHDKFLQTGGLMP
jgi:aspartate kinase